MWHPPFLFKPEPACSPLRGACALTMAIHWSRRGVCLLAFGRHTLWSCGTTILTRTLPPSLPPSLTPPHSHLLSERHRAALPLEWYVLAGRIHSYSATACAKENSFFVVDCSLSTSSNPLPLQPSTHRQHLSPPPLTTPSASVVPPASATLKIVRFCCCCCCHWFLLLLLLLLLSLVIFCLPFSSRLTGHFTCICFCCSSMCSAYSPLPFSSSCLSTILNLHQPSSPSSQPSSPPHRPSFQTSP